MRKIFNYDRLCSEDKNKNIQESIHAMIYCFGKFQLDTDTNKLCSGNIVICDDEKIVRLLESLCASYPDVVDKQTLIDVLWPDQVVTDWSLSRLISDTRQILGENGKDQENIKTIRGRGFRLNTEVKIAENTAVAGKITKNHSKSIKNNTQTEQWATKKVKVLVLTLLLLVGSSYIITKWINIEKTTQPQKSVQTETIRVAVLPIVNKNSDPMDDWVKIGIMSMATEQLGHYQSIQTLPVTTILTALKSMPEKMELENLTTDQAQKLCLYLGCTHLISIQYSLKNNLPLLTYQIFNQGKRSAISEFSQADVIDTVDMLLDHLATDLIPAATEQLQLSDTYSKDVKANRDYAIGVHELFSGDYKSAIDYFKIALNKEPDFFWAKAYYAEAEYRSGHFTMATQLINSLQNGNVSNKQTYFLLHLKSNVLYSQGKITESLAASKALLTNVFVLDDPLLKGNELLNVGSSYQALGEMKKAISFLQQSRKSYHDARFGSGEGKVLYNLGNVFLASNKKREAINYYQQAREVFKKYGLTGYALMAKHSVATTNASLGRLQFAERELSQLVEEYKKIGDIEGEITAHLDQAVISFDKKDILNAKIKVDLALKLVNVTELDSVKNQTKALAARIYLALGDVKQAELFFSQLNPEWHDIRPSFVFIKAHILHDKGDLDGAVKLAQQIKLKLKNNWTKKHEAILQQFISSQKSGKILKVEY